MCVVWRDGTVCQTTCKTLRLSDFPKPTPIPLDYRGPLSPAGVRRLRARAAPETRRNSLFFIDFADPRNQIEPQRV